VNDEGAARIRALVQAISDLGELSGARMLDLGAGDGEIAVELALRGARVVAVEGRAENAADIRSLGADRRAAVELIESDVRALDWAALGSFDVIVCSGLLYHLVLADALALARSMRGACTRLLLVDTEVAWGPVEQAEADGRSYSGLQFRENPSRLSSIGNEESFWLTRPSLHALLYDAGFASSWELGAPWQPRRETRVTVAALAGDRVSALELDRSRALPDPRPVEPAAGRVLRARLALAKLRQR
jgi:SAM-dependent methyltransferase